MKKCKWCNSMISDDAAICPYCKATVSNISTSKTIRIDQGKQKNNSIANALGIIGKVTIILGIISCILCLFSEQYILSIPFLVASLISGCTFLGFAEVIQLLQDIKDKME